MYVRSKHDMDFYNFWQGIRIKERACGDQTDPYDVEVIADVYDWIPSLE